MSLRTLGDVVRRAGGAVSVREDVSVADLARALQHHRVDAAAVLTRAGVLAGLATATDVARTVARAEDPEATPVASVMTVHPTMLPPTESPASALAIMRSGAFRHLPVVEPSSGAVLGIVDVLHLAYDAIVRLHNSYAMPPTKRSFLFQVAARETIEKPTLRSFGDTSKFTALLPDHTALDACEALVRNHAAAIIVVDATGVLEGIFTSRDITARVVAAGLNPAATKLRDVMTARPDFALPDFTVLECLQRMQACGFRHLPIVDEMTRRVVGLVDVLQLASDALSGLNSAPRPGVPLPTSPRAERNASAMSGSSVASTATTASRTISARHASASAGRLDVPGGAHRAPAFSSIFTSLFSSGAVGSPSAAIPSVAMLNAEDRPSPPNGASPASRPIGVPSSAVEGAERGRRARTPTSSAGARQISKLNAADLARMRMTSQFAPGGSGSLAGHAYGDGGGPSTITFKFKDSNSEYRRIKVPCVMARGSFDQLVIDIRHRYYGNAANGAAGSGSIRIKYIDEEGDAVVISNDDDLAGCFEECIEQKLRTVKVRVTEVQSRRSLTSVQSPVSSRPTSPPPGEAPGEAASSESNSRTESASGIDHTSMASPTTSSPASPSTSRAAEAHALMMDQRLSQAIAKYDEAVKINSANARALAGRGAAKLITGDPAGAENDYRASLKVMDGNPTGGKGDRERTFDMVVVGLVETLIEQRRYEEATEMSARLDGKPSKSGCADALRDELDASAGAARSALSTKEYGEAMALFSNALRVERAFIAVSEGREGESPSLRNGRGRCYVETGDYEMALEDFMAASKIDTESVAAWKGCGKCYVELDDAEKALEAYRKAGKLDSGDDDVQEQIRVLEGMLPDPNAEKKDAIAKLGAMLGGLNLPSGSTSVQVARTDALPKPVSRATSTVASSTASNSLAKKRKARKARKKGGSP